MEETCTGNELFADQKIGRILLKLAPPVMLAQLIQALYNIVDSFFVGRYSADALTALTVVYPIQLVIVALAVGTGVGVNTYMAREYGLRDPKTAQAAAGAGMALEFALWVLFAVLSALILPGYVRTSATEPQAIADAVTYGRIVCLGSIGAFLEGNWTKVHQARGNMRRPMLAQVAGALVNIALDPLLIFGLGPVPALGVAGAAWATVCGQVVAAVITAFGALCPLPGWREMRRCVRMILFYGYSSILMQAMYTVYIVALNVILAGFSDAAVTVLGLYYKMQSFFFIPLFGLQTCVVPVISFNYARGGPGLARCRETVRDALLIAGGFMLVGIVACVVFPGGLIGIFSATEAVQRIGRAAFPIIGLSFPGAAVSLMMPVFFQAIGDGKASLALSVTRQILCLIPSFWLFSRLGLGYAWLAFPVSEYLSGGLGLLLYGRTLRRWRAREQAKIE